MTTSRWQMIESAAVMALCASIGVLTMALAAVILFGAWRWFAGAG